MDNISQLFLEAFNKDNLKNILINKILPEDFEQNYHKLDLSGYKLEKIKEVEFIGKTNENSDFQLSLLFIKHTGINDPRITITKEAFKIIKELYIKNNIVVFYTDNSPNYRISLITFDIEQKGEKGVREVLSNPRRYSYFLGPNAKIHTPTKNLILKGRVKSEENLKDRFSVEVVTKEFYQELANWYFWALKVVEPPKDVEKENNGRNIFLIRFITRILFIWFMRRKGIVSDMLFDKEKLKDILKSLKDDETTYYTAILQNLFFATLNTPIHERKFRKDERYKGIANDYMNHRYYRYHSLFKNPNAIMEIFKGIPFLNGGLFECLDKKAKDEDNYTGKEIRSDGFSDVKSKQPKFPNKLFFSEEEVVDLSQDYNNDNYKKTKVRGIINILETYNFTIDENSPIDIEVSLDPELLGRVFENLLASYNPETAETARKSSGSYYTPREIVDYMVSESLKEYLKENLNNIADIAEKLDKLFSYDDDNNPFNDKEADEIIKLINRLKVIDPAVGSGAFPMGMLQKLVFILSKLDPHNQKWKEEQIKSIENISDPKLKEDLKNKVEEYFKNNELNYGRKLYLIQNCLYGVDIQPIAIHIAKLRFFISLLVDEKYDNSNGANNFGIEPLPNLETKLVSADTLIFLDKDDNLMPMGDIMKIEEELFEIRKKYFYEQDKKKKDFLKKKDKQKREELKKLSKELGNYHKHIDQIVEWDLYNTNKSSDWFDPEWMFGVKDGFDIVIGNPPYGDIMNEIQKKSIKKTYKYSTTTDISSPFCEKGINLLKNNGNLVYIITYAITFNKDFSGIRKILYDNFERIYLYSFDRDKCRIFESMSQSVSILKAFKKGGNIKKGIFTSRMFRDTPDITKIEVSNADNFLLPIGSKYENKHRLPKIGEELNLRILNKILSQKNKFKDIISESGEKIWIRTSGNYWYNAWDKNPYKSSEIKQLKINNNFSDFAVLIMNSSLFYFWFRIFGDGRHMNYDILEEFPIPELDKIEKFNHILNKLRKDFMNSLFSVFDKSGKRFETSKIKSEIDKVDLFIGRFLYGLNYREILYVMDYDKEVRTGIQLKEFEKFYKTFFDTNRQKELDKIVFDLYFK